MPSRSRATRTRRIAAILSAGATIFAATGSLAQAPPMPSEVRGLQEPRPGPVDPHMSESLRDAIDKVVVIAGQGAANEEVSGTYERETAGFLGGWQEGSRMGTISREVGGVPINLPIPGLALPGAILGSLTGATKRQIQEFRDRLTEEIINAESPPLRSDGLANDALWVIRRQPELDSHLFSPRVEISEDTDAVLYISIDNMMIAIQGKEAIITTSALGTVRRQSDGRDVYRTVVHYEDRDTLRNWTANDNALWRDYTNFARYFLGREVAADVFGKVALDHQLVPRETESVERARKDERKFVSESLTPTLAWDLTLAGGDPYGGWSETIDENDITYDIDVFDNHTLVYDEKGIRDSSHTLAWELEPCRTYRWSVRPVYNVAGQTRFGEWMRYEFEDDDEDEKDEDREESKEVIQKGVFGRKASDAPAYIQDFPMLEIECR